MTRIISLWDPLHYRVLGRVTQRYYGLTGRVRQARAMARHHMELYLQLPNYTNNMICLGFSDDDFRDGGSDHLVDALVTWGDVDAIAERVAAQLAAGADSVCVQVLNGGSFEFPRQRYRDLAKVLF